MDARSYLAEAALLAGGGRGPVRETRTVHGSRSTRPRICRDLVAAHPGDFSFQADLAEILGGQGDAQLRLGLVADADKSYHAALDHLQAALRHDPDAVAYALQLPLAHERLAALAERKGDLDEARAPLHRGPAAAARTS